MIPALVRLYHPTGPDRVAVVSTEPSYGRPGEHLIQVGRGPEVDRLGAGSTFGPFSESDLPQRFDEIVTSLREEGFVVSGQHDLLLALGHEDSAVRAHAALRLGWRREQEAVEPILARIDEAVDDLCSLLDALGMIGDPRAIPVLLEQSRRKLLSRRRSAAEALRNIGDAAAVAEVRETALERLPVGVREACESHDPDAIVASLDTVETIRRGLTLDTLYELATPAACEAVRRDLDGMLFAQPYVWRYVKSILKRSMLRHDAVTFGRLAHRIERQARMLATGTTASVKSGYDGVERETPIFGRSTRNYVRRSTWRYLRRLARHRPETYSAAAAEALVHYEVDDTTIPRGRVGRFGHCYLLHRILFGGGNRFTFDDRRLVFRFTTAGHTTVPPPSVREEAFPELWDAAPAAYVRLLAAARLPEVHEFAHRAIRRSHPALLEGADDDQLVAMLTAVHEQTVRLATGELDRRFDPANPNWSLLDPLVASTHAALVELATSWLPPTATLWAGDVERAITYLQAPDGSIQSLVVSALTEALSRPELENVRRPLARYLLERVRGAGGEDTTPIDGMARVLREALVVEVGELLPETSDVLALVAAEAPAVQSIGAAVLASRPGVLAELGLTRIAVLAEHPLAVVRSAAHALLGTAVDDLREDPSLLFLLVESPWADTRTAARGLLDEVVDWSRVDVPTLVGLLDSNRPDVQEFAIRHARANLERLDATALLERLVEHPARDVRRFAFELIDYLPDGVEPLRRIERFFRAGLIDTWPRRDLKHGIIAFLVNRGLRDAEQAAFAVELFDELVRTDTRGDFERVLQALARLRVAHPHVESAVELTPVGATAVDERGDGP